MLCNLAPEFGENPIGLGRFFRGHLGQNRAGVLLECRLDDCSRAGVQMRSQTPGGLVSRIAADVELFRHASVSWRLLAHLPDVFEDLTAATGAAAQPPPRRRTP